MVLTESTNMPAGASAPEFSLPDTTSGETVSLSDYNAKPVVVIFMCNHCPYVVHIVDALVEVAAKVASKGVQTVAISANDAVSYPADSPDNMAQLARAKAFGFPYLYDKDQSVAKAYDAVCTPDIFLFNSEHKLFYRGQFDNTRPGSGAAATGSNLLKAVDELLAGDAAPSTQHPSVGCSIKWLTT